MKSQAEEFQGQRLTDWKNAGWGLQGKRKAGLASLTLQKKASPFGAA